MAGKGGFVVASKGIGLGVAGGVLGIVGGQFLPSPQQAAAMAALLALVAADAVLAVIADALRLPKGTRWRVWRAVDPDKALKGAGKLAFYFVLPACVAGLKAPYPHGAGVFDAMVLGLVGMFSVRELASIVRHGKAFGVAVPDGVAEMAEGAIRGGAGVRREKRE